MRLKLRGLIKPLHRKRRGITGLETSIILIAFVVVASVFAYTILSAGIFTSQKSQETLNSGMKQARSTLRLAGIPIAYGNSSGVVTAMRLTVSSALNSFPIDLTPPTDIIEGNGTGNGIADSGSQNVTVVTYIGETTVVHDLDYDTIRVGSNDGDYMLEIGEKMELLIDLTGVGETIDAYSTVEIEIKPPKGSVLTIEKVMPSNIDSVMVLW